MTKKGASSQITMAPAPVEAMTAVQVFPFVLTAWASLCTHLTSGIHAKNRITNTANFMGDIYPPYSVAAANKIGISAPKCTVL